MYFNAEACAVRMIRKQLYIGSEHQRKLRRLAARWSCTEAEVVRRALDRIPDEEASIESILTAAGLLVPPEEGDVPSEDELEKLEQEYEAWLDTLTEPLGLSEAILEDRR
jgi:hypothetical protein